MEVSSREAYTDREILCLKLSSILFGAHTYVAEMFLAHHEQVVQISQFPWEVSNVFVLADVQASKAAELSYLLGNLH